MCTSGLTCYAQEPEYVTCPLFDLQSPQFFRTSSETLCAFMEQCIFPLHIAAACSESLELLQYLIQTHFAAVMDEGGPDRGRCPLAYLVLRDDFPTFDSMLQCLLDACSDSNVIGNAIGALLDSLGKEIKNTTRILRLVDILLNANPSAAKYSWHTGQTLFHRN